MPKLRAAYARGISRGLHYSTGLGTGSGANNFVTSLPHFCLGVRSVCGAGLRRQASADVNRETQFEDQSLLRPGLYEASQTDSPKNYPDQVELLKTAAPCCSAAHPSGTQFGHTHALGIGPAACPPRWVLGAVAARRSRLCGTDGRGVRATLQSQRATAATLHQLQPEARDGHEPPSKSAASAD